MVSFGHSLWLSMYYGGLNNGYNTLQFYTCDIAPLEYGNSFVGGLQDNGTLVSGILNDDDGSLYCCSCKFSWKK